MMVRILVLVSGLLGCVLGNTETYHLWTSKGSCLHIEGTNLIFKLDYKCTEIHVDADNRLRHKKNCIALKLKHESYAMDLESCLDEATTTPHYLRRNELKNFTVDGSQSYATLLHKFKEWNIYIHLSKATPFAIYDKSESKCVVAEIGEYTMKDSKGNGCGSFIEGFRNIISQSKSSLDTPICMSTAYTIGKWYPLRCKELGKYDISATEAILTGKDPEKCVPNDDQLKLAIKNTDVNCTNLEFVYRYASTTTTKRTTTTSTTTQKPTTTTTTTATTTTATTTATTTTTTSTTTTTTSAPTRKIVSTEKPMKYNSSISNEENLRQLEALPYSKEFKDKTKALINDVSLSLSNFLTDGNENANKSNARLIKITQLLHEIADLVSEKIGNRTDTFFIKAPGNIEFGVSHIKAEEFQSYQFPPQDKNKTKSKGKQPSIELPKGIVESKDGLLKIKSMIHPPIPAMNSTKDGTLMSNTIVSTRVTPKVKDLQGDLIQLQFPIEPLENLSNGRLRCVYWDHKENLWRSDGCHYVAEKSGGNMVVCQCNHLTDFSVLMSVVDNDKMRLTEQDVRNLSFITTTGCIISIVFLILAVVIIASRKYLRRSQRYQIHINLCISLIVGNIILLFSEKQDKGETLCIAISVMMFYFFIAAFFWMLCEAIFVWRALITIFTENDRIVYYMLFGWGAPMAVVLTTGLVSPTKLTTNETCWLSWEDSTIFAFAAPVLTIIVLNTVILVVVLKATSKHAKDTKRGKIRSLARMVLILLPIFGMTWVFGILAVNRQTLIFRYLFATLNSLQGLFIFICYIQASREVRKELRKATWEQYSSLFKRSSRSQTDSSTF